MTEWGCHSRSQLVREKTIQGKWTEINANGDIEIFPQWQ